MTGGVNWTQVLKRCRPDVHKKIMEVRGRHEELRRLISEAKSAMPKIDFSHYRNALPASANKFVDEIEGSVRSFKIQMADTSVPLQALDAEKAQKMAEAQAFLEDLELDMAKLKHKLELLRNSKPAEELTPDDVYEVRPELKVAFQEALKADNWSTVDETADEKQQGHQAAH